MRVLLGLLFLGFLTSCQTIEEVEPEVAVRHFGELRDSLLNAEVDPKTESQYLRYQLIGLNLGYERTLVPLKMEMDGTPKRIIKQDKIVEHYPARILYEVTEQKGNKEPKTYQEWREDNFYYRILSEESFE